VPLGNNDRSRVTDSVKTPFSQGVNNAEVSRIRLGQSGVKTVMAVSISGTKVGFGAHCCCLRTIFVIMQLSQSPCLGVLNNSAAQQNCVKQVIETTDCGGHHRF
jgi:hypothetical protein